MSKAIKSDFQTILPDDCKQYNELFKKWLDLTQENADEAYEIMKESLALAQRWSEIQATSRKIHSNSRLDFSVTAFKDWAYQRYRNMQLVHEASRVIWRQANEYLMWSRKNSE